MPQSKVTQIEKKYKDKKTGEWKSTTINYSKVADRLNDFRKDHPRSKIMTTHKSGEGDNVIFKARIWKDKTEFMNLLANGTPSDIALLSCDSEGTAEYSKEDEKKYEKLETIAVGRALALLGYAGNGEIASTEEMEEFEAYKSERLEEEKNFAIAGMMSATSEDELRSIFSGLGELMRNPEIVKVKDEMKAKLKKNKKDEEN